MVQVKGMPRPLVQRLSRDLAGRVKYSTLWPSRRDSPSEARRAMPTSGDLAGSANSDKLDIFAFYSPMIKLRNTAVKSRWEEDKEMVSEPLSLCRGKTSGTSWAVARVQSIVSGRTRRGRGVFSLMACLLHLLVKVRPFDEV